MRTVLGLSKTSTTIGWVLVDGEDVTGEPLDHDAFDVSNAHVSAPAATARRVCEIATASGYTVESVHVTTSGNASSLRDALSQAGFDDVVCVPTTEATRAWAVSAGCADGQQTTALCILGRDSASLSVIDARSGAIESATTTTLPDRTGLAEWLNLVMVNTDSRPECLYLVGPRSELDAITDLLSQALSMPVVDTHEAQLALARGAAASSTDRIDDTSGESRPDWASRARTLATVAAIAAAALVTLSSASAPIDLADSGSRQSAAPPTPKSTDAPVGAAPQAPALPPPPPPEVPPSVPEAAVPLSAPEPGPAETSNVAPEITAAPAPQTEPVAPPEQHLPDVQPLQHIPDAQPAALPGPVAPAPDAPEPPPPPDPLAGVSNPVFGGLP